jgi:hypothetical protein
MSRNLPPNAIMAHSQKISDLISHYVRAPGGEGTGTPFQAAVENDARELMPT